MNGEMFSSKSSTSAYNVQRRNTSLCCIDCSSRLTGESPSSQMATIGSQRSFIQALSRSDALDSYHPAELSDVSQNRLSTVVRQFASPCTSPTPPWSTSPCRRPSSTSDRRQSPCSVS